MRRSLLALLALVPAACLAVPSGAMAAGITFTVDTTSDAVDALPGDHVCATADGTCSLRAAIDEGNRHIGPDAIRFAIPGAAPQRIQLANGKLIVNQPDLLIDGYTQPGARPNTDPIVSNALPGIEIVGSGDAAKESLALSSTGTTIMGLAFSNLYKAVWLTGGATGNTIAGDFFGLTAAGARVPDSGYADVLIDGGAHANRIGLPTAAGRNVIDDADEGITMNDPGSDGNVIQNNLIGVSPDGTQAFGNSDNGIDHNYGSKANLIGGTGPLEGNVISGNANDGVEVSHGWNPALPPRADASQPFALVGNRIIGNNIGFRPDGRYDPAFRNGGCYPACAVDNGQGVNLVDGVSDTVVQGNWIIGVRSGIQISARASTGNTIEGNHVGISPSGAVGRIERTGIVLHDGTSGNLIAANTIGGNREAAVSMDDPASFQNRVSQNAMLARSAPAIDLFPTGTANVNGSVLSTGEASERYPLLLSVSRRLVSGTAPAGSLVEIFAAGARPGFFGPGRTYLRTVRATAAGRFRIRMKLHPGVALTATAYGLLGTSEFGPNVAVPGGHPAPTEGRLQDASGTCLGVLGATTKAASRVIVSDCGALATQRWTFAMDGSLRVPGSRCLAPAGGKVRRLAYLVVAACPRSAPRRWARTARGWIRTGSFCLDPRSAVAGSPVRLTRCSNLAEKVWAITP
jgi:hypothetical protein